MDLHQFLPAGGIEALANQLGVPRETAERGAQALLPAVLGGMGDKSDELDSHVNALGGGELADNVTSPEPTDTSRGDQLLGGIFGSKDVSRQVADHAAQNSGVEPSLLKKMLPILAMLVAGQMAKRADTQGGGIGGVLGSVLGSLGAGGAGGGGLGGLGGALGSMLGGGGDGGGGLGGMLGSILGGGNR